MDARSPIQAIVTGNEEHRTRHEYGDYEVYTETHKYGMHLPEGLKDMATEEQTPTHTHA